MRLRFINLEEKSSEISGLLDFQNKIIFINIADSPARQRFTIAHELGHALLHRPELQNNPNLGIFYRKPLHDEIFNSSEEQQANCFAANLLVPEKILRKIYSSCQSHTLLANIFNVSRQVIDIRMENLGLRNG